MQSTDKCTPQSPQGKLKDIPIVDSVCSVMCFRRYYFTNDQEIAVFKVQVQCLEEAVMANNNEAALQWIELRFTFIRTSATYELEYRILSYNNTTLYWPIKLDRLTTKQPLHSYIIRTTFSQNIWSICLAGKQQWLPAEHELVLCSG